MKAMVLRRCGSIETSPLVLEELPDPEPGFGELRVRVEACGICRTDLHVIEGDLPEAGRLNPLVPGHQVVGVVDMIGDGCSLYKEGDRVGIAWLRQTCGDCCYCRQGMENLCEYQLFTGYHAHGGFAEYAVVPESFAYKIPAGFNPAEATPLLCAGIIGYRALKRSGCGPGDSLGLYGFGSSAHIVIQIALSWGCKVFVVSRGKKHQAFALSLGASWVGDHASAMPEKVDRAIMFAPAGEFVPYALANLKKGGTLALAGIYMSDIPTLKYEEHLFYEKNIHSVTANTRKDGLELMSLATTIPIKPRIVTFPFEEANKALKMLKQDQLEGTGVLVF